VVQEGSADAGRVDERNAVGEPGMKFGICAITGRLNVFLPGEVKPASSFCSPRPTQTPFVSYTLGRPKKCTILPHWQPIVPRFSAFVPETKAGSQASGNKNDRK